MILACEAVFSFWTQSLSLNAKRSAILHWWIIIQLGWVYQEKNNNRNGENTTWEWGVHDVVTGCKISNLIPTKSYKWENSYVFAWMSQYIFQLHTILSPHIFQHTYFPTHSWLLHDAPCHTNQESCGQKLAFPSQIWWRWLWWGLTSGKSCYRFSGYIL